MCKMEQTEPKPKTKPNLQSFWQITVRNIQKFKMERKDYDSYLIIDQNQDIAHFDADIADTTIPTTRDLLDPTSTPDPQLIANIDLEIQKSKSNFFNVEIVRQPLKGVTPTSKQQRKRLKVGEHILMEGYLEKKYDSNILFKWSTKYGVLTSEKLYLFDDSHKREVSGCFNFKILPAEIKHSKDELIKISFSGECEELILKAANRAMWLKVLEEVIGHHSSERKLCLKTNLKPFYEAADTITEEEFAQTAQSGDILLFLTDHTAGKLQRFFTQSNYDHVAMIIRINGEVMVFEANQNDGVAVYAWRKFVKYFNLYQKIAFRKLKSPRKKELHHSLLSFARKNVGKKFDIGAYKVLLKQQSDFDWNEEKERGFFCSELIAKALKSVGLIEPVKACSRYWPVDFSSNGSLSLIGASLGFQQTIVLNRHTKTTY